MGALSAMSGIHRVLKAHGEEIITEFNDLAPAGISDHLDTAILESTTYGIEIYWRFKDGSTLPGPSIDIETLADRYPDCDMGY